MKLLQILYPGIGGHSSVAFTLIEGDIQGRMSHSLLGFGIEDPSTAFIDKTEKLNVEYISIKKKPGLDVASQIKVFKYLKNQRPDYIIAHSTSLVLVLFLFSLFFKVNWICVEHQSNLAKSKKDWIYSFLILILAPKIVYLTNDYKSEIQKQFSKIFIERKVFVIPNGINTNRFHPSLGLKSQNGGTLHFSMISRFNNLRDHETLIRAVNEVYQEVPCKLFLAGDGDTLGKYKQLVKELSLEETVCFTGALSEDEVIKLIHNTDIYIHSSLAETMSTSILQVMACKVPIIATDINGINNLLKNSNSALLFKPGDVNDLRNAIKFLIEDQELREYISKNAYREVQGSYSDKIMFSNYMKFFK